MLCFYQKCLYIILRNLPQLAAPKNLQRIFSVFEKKLMFQNFLAFAEKISEEQGMLTILVGHGDARTQIVQDDTWQRASQRATM